MPGRAAPLDRYGNVSEAFINKILSALGAFAEGGYNANRTARSAKRHRQRKPIFFVARSKQDGAPLGIYQIVGSGHVEPVLIFSKKAPSYIPRFHFERLVKESVARNSAKAFNEALARALATAK